jgi:hypothetical protein
MNYLVIIDNIGYLWCPDEDPTGADCVKYTLDKRVLVTLKKIGAAKVELPPHLQGGVAYEWRT